MKITIYTIPDCQFSKQEKEYLQAHNLPFEEKNLESNREYLTEMLSISNNFAGTPVTKIENNGQVQILKGYTAEEFEKTLQDMGVSSEATTEAVAAPAVPATEPVTPVAEPETAPSTVSTEPSTPAPEVTTANDVTTLPPLDLSSPHPAAAEPAAPAAEAPTVEPVASPLESPKVEAPQEPPVAIHDEPQTPEVPEMPQATQEAPVEPTPAPVATAVEPVSTPAEPTQNATDLNAILDSLKSNIDATAQPAPDQPPSEAKTGNPTVDNP